MDDVLGQIMTSLERKHLSDVVNVIVTSDHGMTDSDFATHPVYISVSIDLSLHLRSRIYAYLTMQSCNQCTDYLRYTYIEGQ
jgi:predicted AlkP superfamily pyrophosphatase or phosphodiesterase